MYSALSAFSNFSKSSQITPTSASTHLDSPHPHVPGAILRLRFQLRTISPTQKDCPPSTSRSPPTPRIFPLSLRLLYTRQYKRRSLPPRRPKTRHSTRRGQLALASIFRMYAPSFTVHPHSVGPWAWVDDVLLIIIYCRGPGQGGASPPYRSDSGSRPCRFEF